MRPFHFARLCERVGTNQLRKGNTPPGRSIRRFKRGFWLLQGIVAMLAVATSTVQGVDIWVNASGGEFFQGPNWQDGTAPGPSESALFSLIPTLEISINQSFVLQDLGIADGRVFFFSDGGPWLGEIENLLVQGGDVIVGTSALALNPLDLDAGTEVRVNNGSTLGVAQGSTVSGRALLVSANDGLGEGTVQVDGGTMQFQVATLGGFNQNANLTLDNGAMLIITDQLGLGALDEDDLTRGEINLTNASTLTAEDIILGSLDSSTGQRRGDGYLLADGAGTTITQTGSSTLDVTSGTVRLKDQASLSTGTGQTTIRKGTIEAMNPGTHIDFNGPLVFADEASGLQLTDGATMSVVPEIPLNIDMGALVTLEADSLAFEDPSEINLNGEDAFNLANLFLSQPGGVNLGTTLPANEQIVINANSFSSFTVIAAGGSIEMGSAIGGSVLLNLATDGGVLFNEPTTLRPSVTINATGGSISTQQDLLFDGCQITIDNGGSFSQTIGKMLQMINGATIEVVNGSLALRDVSITDGASINYPFLLNLNNADVTVGSEGSLSVDRLFVGNGLNAGDVSLTIDGADAVFNLNPNLHSMDATEGSTSTWTLNNGAQVLDAGNITINGAGIDAVTDPKTTILNVLGGSQLDLGFINLGTGDGVRVSEINIDGANSQLVFSSFLTIGRDQSPVNNASMNVTNGGRLEMTSATQALLVQDSGTLHIDGGDVELNTLSLSGGTLDFISGRLACRVGGGLTIGAGGPFGDRLALGPDRELEHRRFLTRIASDGILVLDGGTLRIKDLDFPQNFVVDGLMQFNSGIFELERDLVVGSSGVFGANVDLSSVEFLLRGEMTVESDGVLDSNNGRVELAGLSNSGEIYILDGSTDMTGSMRNETGGELLLFNSDLACEANGLADDVGFVNLGSLFMIDVAFHGDLHSPAGSQMYTGGAVMFNGLVSGAGQFPWAADIVFNAGYQPGDSTAAIHFPGAVTFGEGNTLFIEIAGDQPGQFDRITAGQSVTLNGTLDLAAINGFEPLLGQTYTIIEAPSVVGQFDAIEGLGLPNGNTFGVEYASDRVTLNVVGFLPPDFDMDGDVDGDDFSLFESCAAGPMIPLAPGCENRDLDGDTDGDQSDFAVLQRCFSGQNVPANPACLP